MDIQIKMFVFLVFSALVDGLIVWFSSFINGHGIAHFSLADHNCAVFLIAGILFSTLVFGPACGFILGSVCTKFYVDAVFVDTSELWYILISVCINTMHLYMYLYLNLFSASNTYNYLANLRVFNFFTNMTTWKY